MRAAASSSYAERRARADARPHRRRAAGRRCEHDDGRRDRDRRAGARRRPGGPRGSRGPALASGRRGEIPAAADRRPKRGAAPRLHEAPCALACLWIDLGVAKPTRALVYISATASEQVVIRSLPLPAGVDEVAREEVAHIVASSVEALQAGRPLPVATNAADAPLAKAVRAPAPPVAPEAPRTLWLVGVGGGAAHESGAAHVAMPLVGASAGSSDGRSRSLSPALWLSRWAPRGDRRAGRSGSRCGFCSGELAALGAVGTRADGWRRAPPRRRAPRPRARPRAALGDAVVDTGERRQPHRRRRARRSRSVLGRAAARLEVRLFDSAWACLVSAAACDARLVSHRYIIDRDGVDRGALPASTCCGPP